MMMRYQVRFVDEEALPKGHEWVLLRAGQDAFLFIRQSAVDVTTGRCEALARAWEAWSLVSASLDLEQAAG